MALSLFAVAAHALEVDVTADQIESITTDTWSASKVADVSAVTLTPGETSAVTYEVTVSKDTFPMRTVSVSGQVDVYNTSGASALLAALVSTVDGGIPTNAIFDCSGSDLPYLLADLETLTCTYSMTLPSDDMVNHTVTAIVDGSDAGAGSALVDPLSGGQLAYDACVTIEDPLDSFTPRHLCKDDSYVLTYTYPSSVGPYSEPDQCGAQVASNTVTVTGDDSGAVSSATWNIDVTVTCDGGGDPVDPLSKSYWKHNPGDPAWTGVFGATGAYTKPCFSSAKSCIGILKVAKPNFYEQLARIYIVALLNKENGVAVSNDVQNALDSAVRYMNMPVRDFNRLMRKNKLEKRLVGSIKRILSSYNTPPEVVAPE